MESKLLWYKIQEELNPVAHGLIHEAQNLIQEAIVALADKG